MAERRRLDTRPTVGTNQIPAAPFPRASIDAAQSFATAMAGVQDIISDKLDRQVQRRAEKAGAEAGLSPAFRPSDETTLAAEAYNRAGERSFLLETQTRVLDELDRLAENNRANPQGLEQAINAYQQGLEGELQDFPEVVADVRSLVDRNRRTLVREARTAFRKTQQESAAASLYESLEATTNEAQRLARMAEFDDEAAADLAMVRQRYIEQMAAYGPPGEFEFAGQRFEADPTRLGLFSPLDMAKELDSFDDVALEQRVMAGFERADDKLGYIQTFRETQRDNRNSPLSVEQVDTLADSMIADLRSRQSLAASTDAAEARALAQAQESTTVEFMTQILDEGQTVTRQTLQDALASRSISRQQFDYLANMQSAEGVPNDPQAHLELLERAHAADPRMPELIARAVGNAQINSSTASTLLNTYQSAKQRGGILADDAVKRQRQRVDAVLGGVRGPLAVLDSSTSIRVANAKQEFDRRVLEGEDPLEVAESVIERYRITPPSPTEFPRPRYLIGTRAQPNVEASIQATLEAMDRGEITETEATRELENLEAIEDAIRQMEMNNGR